jgi:hypothetical protein
MCMVVVVARGRGGGAPYRGVGSCAVESGMGMKGRSSGREAACMQRTRLFASIWSGADKRMGLEVRRWRFSDAGSLRHGEIIQLLIKIKMIKKN